jgi:hypothetical protein
LGKKSKKSKRKSIQTHCFLKKINAKNVGKQGQKSKRKSKKSKKTQKVTNSQRRRRLLNPTINEEQLGNQNLPVSSKQTFFHLQKLV